MQTSFAMDACRPPEQILACHLFDECDGRAGNLGLRGLGFGYVFPEKAQACPVPAQQRVWLDEYERLPPVGDPARPRQEPEAVAACELGTVDLALQNGELVAQERVFGEQLDFATRDISQGAPQDRRLGGSHSATEGSVRAGKTTLPEFFEE